MVTSIESVSIGYDSDSMGFSADKVDEETAVIIG